jgi:tetrahydromethanopterin S-methyltransferase subunit G
LRESSARLDRMDQRFDRIDERFDRLEDRLAKQFGWIIGMQVTVLLAFVGSVVTLVVMRG